MTRRQQQEDVEVQVEPAPRQRGEVAAEPGQEVPPEEAIPQGEYEMHIRLDRGMQPTLQSITQLAFKMGEIQKATLEELMSLFIVWGVAIMKRKWLDRFGYH